MVPRRTGATTSHREAIRSQNVIGLVIDLIRKETMFTERGVGLDLVRERNLAVDLLPRLVKVLALPS